MKCIEKANSPLRLNQDVLSDLQATWQRVMYQACCTHPLLKQETVAKMQVKHMIQLQNVQSLLACIQYTSNALKVIFQHRTLF